ncbi:MAG: lysine--tRNA ligase, partial [Candidatus Omnitrophica bacterium]|nr:lysine--tRNA ligase [Candidatus Omnitrophota bacterium]
MKGVILYNVINMEDINEIIRERLNKLEAIKSAGIDAYGSRFEKSTAIKELLNGFEEGKEARIAGRVMSIRGHGKSVFSDIKDQTARLQIYLKKDTLGDGQFELFSNIDIGDIIGVNGKLFKTKTGEVTLNVSEFVLLSKGLRPMPEKWPKGLRPMPEKWHGLKDIETRYRQRYLDIIVNEDVKEVFLTRTRIITMIRKFLDSRGYLEVETPMMQPIPGGATARPFITHHNALGIDLYLRIAPELYLKRLLVGGFEKVYEINRNFRNEGISTRHNPEFTMLEVYASYCDYTDMMNLVEDLFGDISVTLFGGLIIEYKGVRIDLTPPWRRIGMLDILKEETGLDFSQVEDVKKAARELGVETAEDKTR